ncbi:MAG TPA: hypothetical protein VJZ71_13230 [Phycisphaerae bacterium]|nr:hypothetical protein [Phycisphaerae bacterium]
MTAYDDTHRYSETECWTAFERLFPFGFAGEDVFREIAPEGWEKSPLLPTFHPSVRQVHDESVRIHRNLRELCKGKNPGDDKPEPTFEETAASYQDPPIEPQREISELVGKCLWDVFSDNHEVVDRDGRVVDIGSFRGSGGFIADFLNRHGGRDHYDYIDFYMGTIWIGSRADLKPVYKMIFRRLKSNEFDWVYHFPRLYAVDLRGLHKQLGDDSKPDWADYSPSEAFAKEQEEKEKNKEITEFRESLDQANREAVQAAQESPPPETVTAFVTVYGRVPRGWPPEIEY